MSKTTLTSWRVIQCLSFGFLTVFGAEPIPSPVAVPTFECLGLYWKAPGGGTAVACEVSYRSAGDGKWHTGLPLWYDPRNQEYRGSIVNLQPGTLYEVRLQLGGATTEASLKARTWPDSFPVGKEVSCAPSSAKTLVISESGTQDGFVLYQAAGGAGAAIDVAGQADYCVVVKASHVILRGLTLKGARIHAILLEGAVHDVVIEGCDISGWGRVAADGWGKDYDAAVYSKNREVRRVIIQRNRIHHPRSNSNNWQQARPGPGKKEPSHPEGPQAVCLWDSEGNHVIRYNTVFSDEDHQYNDIFGAGQNFSTRGFPNRDSDIYGNLLSNCWDDAIESEGANCNVRIWGNYISEAFVGVACASTSIGPLYVWRNVTGIIREAPGKVSGAFLKVSDKVGGGKIYVFHNTVLQPPSPSDPNKTLGAVVGLGWGGPMTNVTSRNNVLHVTRQAIIDRAHDPLGDYDSDLYSARIEAADGQEKHGIRGVPSLVAGHGLQGGRGTFALAPQSPGFDAGVRIPNFNDDFAGAAPDVGAQEAGSAPMEFGATARQGAGAAGAALPHFPEHLADYDSELRRPDGRVDIDAMVRRLREAGVTTYYWLVWHAATDWEDLKLFLPKAKEANIDVWVYLVPPSESPPSYGSQYSEPFRLDYRRWAEEIARLSLQHTNLTAWVIDDFYANHALFTPASLREMRARAQRLNPRLAFLPLMYFNEITRKFAEDYREVIDGVVVAYPQDRDEISYARAILNGETVVMPGQLALPWNTPTAAGDFAAAELSAQVLSTNQCRVRFREQDDFTGPTAGYQFKQLLVDETVAWEEDVAGGTAEWRDVEVDVTQYARGKTNVTLSFRLLDKKGVSNFGVRWRLADLRAKGLQPSAGLNNAQQWRVRQQGPLEAGFGDAAQRSAGRFHIPFIVMTAANASEFKQRHGDPASPGRIADWLRMCLQARADGLCDGVVTYCLDKEPNSPTFPLAQKLFKEFRDPP